MTELKPYGLSSATDLEHFIHAYCSRCARDALLNGSKTEDDYADSDLCPAFNRVFSWTPGRGAACAPEWRESEEGIPLCTDFEPLPGGQRDPLTADMFP
jgi:hypothetical protein